jgi:hypothetical protein
MKKPTFAELLTKYMRRIRASERNVAVEIGVTNETVNKWKNGTLPHKNNRDKVLKCAHFLRLTESETHEFIRAAFPDDKVAEIEKLPNALFSKYISELLHKLSKLDTPVILLLAQKNNWDKLPFHNFRKALLKQAQQKYSQANVLYIEPPSCAGANIDEYFSELAKQCEFKDVKDALDFELKLKERSKNQETFLFIFRLDRCPQLLREQLGGIIRSVLDEMEHSRLHVILWGGEKLAELKFQESESSLLNYAQIEQWELSRTEVLDLCQYCFPKLQLDEESVNEILKLSGGHPQLLMDCLKLKQQEPDLDWDEYPKRLSQCDYVWQLFTQFAQDEPAKQQVYQWLQQKCLGKSQPYIMNNLLRKLYWENLLVERDINGTKQLCWRCLALRMAGKEILKPQQ